MAKQWIKEELVQKRKKVQCDCKLSERTPNLD